MILGKKQTGKKVLSTGMIVLGAVLLVVATSAMGPQERQEREREQERERQEMPQQNMTRGKVVSADASEVVVESDADGKVFVFRVLNRWHADGTRGPDEDVSAFTAALKKDDFVVVTWGYAQEGEFHFIRTIATGEATFAFTHDRNVITGWVIGKSERLLTIKTIEKGSKVEFLLPERTAEREERPRTEREYWERQIAERASDLAVGQLVLIGYRSDEERERMWLNNVRPISF